VVLLLNGIDHAPPEVRTEALAKEIGRSCGFEIERGLLDDFVARVDPERNDRPSFSGELIGGRVAPLLPGVWSTRTWIKLENRRAEAELEAWAEPFAALASRFGLADERPALRLAWKELLKNQAHDSICGCSRDEVHEQMRPRFDAARELGEQTARRCLERLAGLAVDRPSPWSCEFDLFVANPSARTRTDRVRFPLDFHPYIIPNPNPAEAMHPTVLQDLAAMQFSVDGVPARLVPAEVGRMKLLPERRGFDLEFVARDVPALGFRRVQVRLAAEGVDAGDCVEKIRPGDPEATIEADDVRVTLCQDGRFDLRIGDREYPGLGELENTGDRGDSYDYDEVSSPRPGFEIDSIAAERRSHASGIQELRVVRNLRVPESLAPTRTERSTRTVSLEVETILRVVPGVSRVDIDVRIMNPARDHRLRMLFPVGGRVTTFEAATTFDVAERVPGPSKGTDWVQPPPATFPHQGFVHANGLSVVAPGLAEAELVDGESGRIAITLLRCVGSLSRFDLTTRRGPAGPGTDTPGAQCPGSWTARISLFCGLDPAEAREAEVGLRAVPCGDEPLVPDGVSQIELESGDVIVSALKPVEEGEGLVLRVLNSTGTRQEARICFGFSFDSVESVRLDETPDGREVERVGSTVCLSVSPHGLRTVRID
jgi:hypothetical protein